MSNQQTLDKSKSGWDLNSNPMVRRLSAITTTIALAAASWRDLMRPIVGTSELQR
jgi:hypothetical protein